MALLRKFAAARKGAYETREEFEVTFDQGRDRDVEYLSALVDVVLYLMLALCIMSAFGFYVLVLFISFSCSAGEI